MWWWHDNGIDDIIDDDDDDNWWISWRGRCRSKTPKKKTKTHQTRTTQDIHQTMTRPSIYLPVIFFMCPLEISSSSFGIWIGEKRHYKQFLVSIYMSRMPTWRIQSKILRLATLKILAAAYWLCFLANRATSNFKEICWERQAKGFPNPLMEVSQGTWLGAGSVP